MSAAQASEVPEAQATSTGQTPVEDQSHLPPGRRKYRRLDAPTPEQIASVSIDLTVTMHRNAKGRGGSGGSGVSSAIASVNTVD
jgi:hypothetical protein